MPRSRIASASAVALTAPASTRPSAFVGIDLSKDHLDLAWLTSGSITQHLRLPNSTAGLKALTKHLNALPCEITLVVIEATGGLERPVSLALTTASLPVVIANPLSVRRFAQAMGRLAKTDRIDADVLAHFAERVRPQVRPLPSQEQHLLDELVTRRQQIVGMLTSEKNRLRQVSNKWVKRSLSQVIQALEKQLKASDGALREQIETSQPWQQQDELMQSVPGVGPVLSATLLAALPELNRLTEKQLASLVGVAPHAAESGRWRGVRHCTGGRASVRTVLYMGALAATRFNPAMREFYQQLLKRGKEKKVALVACMRKLLRWLSAIVKSGQRWNAELHPISA